MMLQMWVLVMDSSPFVSPSLPPGSAKADHAAASPVNPLLVLPPGIAWTMMSRILLTPRPLGEPPLDSFLHGPDCFRLGFSKQQLSWMETDFMRCKSSPAKRLLSDSLGQYRL